MGELSGSQDQIQLSDSQLNGQVNVWKLSGLQDGLTMKESLASSTKMTAHTPSSKSEATAQRPRKSTQALRLYF